MPDVTKGKKRMAKMSGPNVGRRALRTRGEFKFAGGALRLDPAMLRELQWQDGQYVRATAMWPIVEGKRRRMLIIEVDTCGS